MTRPGFVVDRGSAADLEPIASIERESFHDPMDAREFQSVLKSWRHNLLVARRGLTGEVVGWLVYQINVSSLLVIQAAVAPTCRRKGVGAALLGQVAGELGPRRHWVAWSVPDDELAGHLWLRSCGWRAVRIEGDRYVFQYPPPESRNRAGWTAGVYPGLREEERLWR